MTFIYGEHDWMDYRAGQRVAAELDQVRPRSCPSDHEVEVVPDSGHFVFIEQPEDFNAALLDALGRGGGREGDGGERLRRAAREGQEAAVAEKQRQPEREGEREQEPAVAAAADAAGDDR